ncbi:hypothetical protein QJS10_CPB04g00525 [Acorus calamus]|uniref:RINT1-like protein MAG2L n=1 Tax=Acorus calamus TaxID=4465 RepID=A0AAV9EXV7_ACOCL|nr:hypothetical protein QJS10_CPB04g00525 [Acorus calamus]
MEVPMALPDPSSISRGLLGFLDDHFNTRPDLTSASSLAAKLRSDCCDSEGDLIDLKTKLSSLLSLWTSLSNDVSDLLDRIDSDLCFSPDGYEEVDFGRVERALCMELPLLAKEVRRVETVRSYVETALRLESLVGDLEDAAYSSLSQNMRATLSNASTPIDIGSKQEYLLLAIKAMKSIEEVLVRITNCRPQWTHLLNAVDSRVDKTLCLLRPQAIMDHRAVLSSLGWPPQLSASNLENGKSSELPNPLVLMQGDKKEMMDKHFSKWIDEPKFIFALVYKVTRDFVEGVDDVLQPLIDKARLVGRNAKEAWVSSMVKMLFKYLKTKCFSAFMESLGNSSNGEFVASRWNLGHVIFVVNVCDLPDWLGIWSDIELKDAEEKLKSELDNERAWKIDLKHEHENFAVQDELYLLSSREDYRAPLIAETVIKIAWTMMERDRLRVLNASLNAKDFFDIWRCVAGGIDHFIFTSILSSDVVFSVQGVHQFTADMQALFQVFKSFCPRPGAFFPCLSDLLKLLTSTSQEVKRLLELLSKNEEDMESWRRLGLHCVSSAQAEKVLKNLIFENQC